MVAAAMVAWLMPAVARAQWVTTYDQFYLQAPHNWEFRDRYAHADRLFNAFDYGHAILYETLWTRPDAPASRLEEREYDFLTKRVLVRPPRVPLEEIHLKRLGARLQHRLAAKDTQIRARARPQIGEVAHEVEALREAQVRGNRGYVGARFDDVAVRAVRGGGEARGLHSPILPHPERAVPAHPPTPP